jgi:AcrR family transcriptional regulator/NAD(P)-dependent dehydrogenase (short-subunit alcohol dehydrogenase family)
VFDIATTVKNKQLVQKRREQITLAAIKLFAKKGFHKTTLRDLAQEIGVSHGHIYAYVGSKEDIFYLIHHFLADVVMKTIERSIEGLTDPIHKLRQMVKAEFDIMSEWSDAVLLLYQEGHILPKTLLSQLLQNERLHMQKFESVLEECKHEGLINECNIYLTAHFIKSMIDSWVLKRWDLQGRATQIEAERSIVDIVLGGILKPTARTLERTEVGTALKGKAILVVNGGTLLGAEIVFFLISQGARVCIYLDELKQKDDLLAKVGDDSQNIRFYSADSHGPMTPLLLKTIDEDFGPIQIYLHDLNVETHDVSNIGMAALEVSRRTRENLTCAENIGETLKERKANELLERIIYIGQWAWEKRSSLLRYEMIKAETVALVRSMAKAMASSRATVNCIMPGYILTGRQLRGEEKVANNFQEMKSRRNFSMISDVINAVCFLSSESSRYLSGQVLSIFQEAE